MNISFALPCIKTGAHLDETLRSIFASAETANQRVTVNILTPLAKDAFAAIPCDPAGKVAVHILAVEASTGMMGKFDQFLSLCPAKDPDEIIVFSNDDVIFAPEFLTRLAQTSMDNLIVGPVIRTPDGSWQTSMFRKRFSLLRLMFRVYDGGLYSRFIRHPTCLERINEGRTTVDGCCFLLNERTLLRFGRRFNFVAYLYMEEVLFQVLNERLGIRSKVVEELEITHIGGASLTHSWSAGKSRIQLDSVTSVSRDYLGHMPWQTAMLRGWFRVEDLMRRFLTKVMS